MLNRLLIAGALFAAGSAAASAASIDKSVTVKAPAAKVWEMIGPFCSIKDWHPAIGKCTEESGVRTLVTKDGKATFEEKQTANEPKEMMYSYEILKSPLPIKNYKSTLKVTKVSADETKIDWSSTYTPDEGKDAAANEAISGIYQSGRDNIEKMAGK